MATTMTLTTERNQPVGELLRAWRERRRLSQMALALDAEVSTRHLSFLETGRARPSREMLLRLAEHLAVPLRERNALLLAAGYAPAYPERPLDDPALAAAREAVARVLAGHEPYPALAIDREWTLVAANRAVAPLLAGVAPSLLRPPVNILRLALHPKGLASRTVNLPEWRAHLLSRLERQIAVSADSGLARLLDELRAYPAPEGIAVSEEEPSGMAGVAVPFQVRAERGVLGFLSTTMVFGTPVDVTLSELAIEAFFPIDTRTAEAMRDLAGDAGS
ncbi:MAG: helix-turn-helix transcriptional regulator [Thermomicrobiales bacterium]|nr:helix-turn-helix transcriptional regulator [Thermomicrobiales bacterium]